MDFHKLLHLGSILSTLADLPGSFPQNCFEQVFCKVNLRAPASVKKDLYSWRYLRNFPEFQKCARLESAVFGMQFTKKELHYRHQPRNLRKLFGVNFANWNFQKNYFLKDTSASDKVFDRLCNVEISPITLLKSDSSREALLAILKTRKTHRKYFRWSQFSVQL